MNRLVYQLFISMALIGLAGIAAASSTIIGSSNATLCYNESQIQFGNDPQYCTLALRNDNLSQSDQAATYSNRGIIYSRRGEYEKALADHNKAIELEPTMAQPYINRGNVYHHMQNLDAALQEYQKAIELATTPDYLPYYNAGLTLIKLKRDKEATEMLQQALTLAPELSSVRQRLLELTRP